MGVGPAPTLSRPRARLPTHGPSSLSIAPLPSFLCRPLCLSHRDTSAFSSPFSWPPPPGCLPPPWPPSVVVSFLATRQALPVNLPFASQLARFAPVGPGGSRPLIRLHRQCEQDLLSPAPNPSTPDVISPNSSPLNLQFISPTVSYAHTGHSALISLRLPPPPPKAPAHSPHRSWPRPSPERAGDRLASSVT